MSTKTTAPNRVERVARLGWVPIALMRVSPLAQRELNRARVDKIASQFDPEQVGIPSVNKRSGHYYIIDGQHRVEAMREIGWADQQIQCQVYDGLTESEEAEKFLKLNDVLTVSAFSRFKVGVQAGRQRECDIDRIVRASGCVVTNDDIDGAIGAVGTLTRIYEQGGAKVLARTIRIVFDAFGTPGLVAAVLDGMGLVCARYNGDLPDQLVVAKLNGMRGGMQNLLGKAEVIRRQTGLTRNHSVAAAIVEIVNSGKGGTKISSWFREDAA